MLNSRALIPAITVPALLGLYLLLTSTVFLADGYPVYDVKRVIQLTLIPIMFVLTLTNRQLRLAFHRQLSRCPDWILGLMSAIVIAGVVSAAVNADTIMHFAWSLAMVALPALLVLSIPVVAACRALAGKRFDQVALSLLFLTAMAVGVQEALGQIMSSTTGINFTYKTALMHFGHPRFYNQFQSWAVPLLAAIPLVYSRRPLVLVACAAVLGLQWYILFITGARGSLLSLSLAILVSIVIFGRVRRHIIKWQGVGILIGGLFYGIAVLSVTPDSTVLPVTAGPSAPSVQNKAENSSSTVSDASDSVKQSMAPDKQLHELGLGRPMIHTSGRSWLWRDAFHQARDNPFLGAGPLNYACRGYYRRPAHPHSLPIQILGEWGVPVTFAVMIVVLYLAWRLIQNVVVNRSPASTTLPGITVFAATGVLAAGLHSLVSGVHLMPASQVTGILVCGWLLGTIPIGGRFRTSRFSTVLLGAGLVASLVLLLGSAIEMRKLEYRETQMEKDKMLYPRFWQNGKVCTLFVDH